MSEQDIEQKIQDKGLNAPRLTPRQIDAQIVKEDYHVFEGTTTTVCCLTLQNGYNVIGKSAAASLENFDVEIGKELARTRAREAIWELEGYKLKSILAGEFDDKEIETNDVEKFDLSDEELNRIVITMNERDVEMRKVLKPLEGKQRMVMENIIKDIPTEQLQKGYDMFISRVIQHTEDED